MKMLWIASSGKLEDYKKFHPYSIDLKLTSVPIVLQNKLLRFFFVIVHFY